MHSADNFILLVACVGNLLGGFCEWNRFPEVRTRGSSPQVARSRWPQVLKYIDVWHGRCSSEHCTHDERQRLAVRGKARNARSRRAGYSIEVVRDIDEQH